MNPVFRICTAFVHEGHGRPGEGHSLAHYLTEPVHVIAMVAVVAAITALVFHVRRRLLSASVRRRKQGLK